MGTLLEAIHGHIRGHTNLKMIQRWRDPRGTIRVSTSSGWGPTYYCNDALLGRQKVLKAPQSRNEQNKRWVFTSSASQSKELGGSNAPIFHKGALRCDSKIISKVEVWFLNLGEVFSLSSDRGGLEGKCCCVSTISSFRTLDLDASVNVLGHIYKRLFSFGIYFGLGL